MTVLAVTVCVAVPTACEDARGRAERRATTAAGRWVRLAEAVRFREDRAIDEVPRALATDDYTCDLDEVGVAFYVASSETVALHVAWCPGTGMLAHAAGG